MANNFQDPFSAARSPSESVMPDLDNISSEIDRIADSIERHFKAVASSLLEWPVAASIRETIQSSPWLYEAPTRPPPPPSRSIPTSYLRACQRWIFEHRAVTAAVVAFVGTGAVIVYRQRRADRAKRRAKRAKNGARTEVVVLAGSPHSPLTKSLSLDLERRGFIVYIPVGSLSEEHIVHSEARADIRPLHLDITSENSTALALQKLSTHLTTSHRPHPHSSPHTLHLASLILLPAPSFPTQPISTLPPPLWSDTLNAHLLSPILTLRAFLPLLLTQKASLLLLTPSIIPSLTPASHAPESVIAAGLDAYISTLRREIPSSELGITTLKLGSFDYGPMSAYERQLVARNSEQRTKSGERWEGWKGSSLRELHVEVFDVIARGKGSGGTIFVGTGSRAYDLVARWIPSGVVGWMLGLRRGA